MRCKDVQKNLAVDARLAQLSARDRAHLLHCPGCRQVQSIYADIDNELRKQPAWQPPPGFAERVSLQGLASLTESSIKTHGFSGRMVGSAGADSSSSIPLGLLAAAICLLLVLNGNAVAYDYSVLFTAFSKALLANAGQLAWSTAILSICFSAWITKRALR